MPLTDDTIGQVAQRQGATYAGRSHLIDSVVADAVVTACGRRMRQTTRYSGELAIASMPAFGPTCRTCKRLYGQRSES